jgi:hypothetical protein
MILVRRMLFLALSAILALGTSSGMASQSAGATEMPCMLVALAAAPAMPECCGGGDKAACMAHCAAMLLAQVPASESAMRLARFTADPVTLASRPFSSFAAPPGGRPPK